MTKRKERERVESKKERIKNFKERKKRTNNLASRGYYQRRLSI
jgi:hypothetical protein